MDQKKCYSCGQWSDWKHSNNDLCIHCGKLLDKEALEFEKRKNESEAITVKKNENSFLTIKPTDKWPIVFVKSIANVANAIFIAIMAFLVWFATAIAG